MTSFEETTTRSLVTGWLAALWSGEYDQLEGLLSDDTQSAFCVEGVLADQCVRAGFASWDGFTFRFRDRRSRDYLIGALADRTGTNENVDTDVLVRVLIDVTGFSEEEVSEVMYNGVVPYEATVGEFIRRVNDKMDVSFDQLAHFLHEIYDEHLDVDLPPKDEIMDLADRGTCETDTETFLSTERERVSTAA